MNREQLELILFKAGIVDKHIKNFINLLVYLANGVNNPTDEIGELEAQTLIYQLYNLEKMCGFFFQDAFTLKQIQQLKNDEIMKEIHKGLQESEGLEDGV